MTPLKLNGLFKNNEDLPLYLNIVIVLKYCSKSVTKLLQYPYTKYPLAKDIQQYQKYPICSGEKESKNVIIESLARNLVDNDAVEIMGLINNCIPRWFSGRFSTLNRIL